MLSKTTVISILLLLAVAGVSQTPGPSEDARGVIRLRVRVAQSNKAKGLPRKRFFLVKGSLEDNKVLIENLERQTIISRDCYYRSKGASEALITWLRENDCESVYCREVEQKNVDGAEAVPEFQRAAAAGEKEFGSRELARKWVTVNLANDLRSGFYKLRQQSLQAFLKQAESVSHDKVMSVMTDSNGTAYFTDLQPGVYVISNILPTQVGSSSSLWNCPITVKPGDLATEKPFLISNPGNKDPKDVRNIKCSSLEKPLPVCESTPK
ncbi:MAG: hypothetical protein AABN95_09010 [Acidobacteriota bacterium]